MSQSIERLKELLFENETTALADLSRRIASLSTSEAEARAALARQLDGVASINRQAASELQDRIVALSKAAQQAREEFTKHVNRVADIDARARDELADRLDRLHERTGDDERLTASIAQIIGEALRRAEIAHHVELSETIAPLVVTTIKTELRNSQDEMVEALYPITGRLVKSYVASAIKDLTEQMNRRLEQNPVMLRLQSLATGRSVAELALAGTNDFTIKDLYLIRRGSGELLAHWPEVSSSGRDQVMSGVLAAVNEFANEAFSADQSSLREIDLGGEQVYLRGSPLYLLAARCSGQAPKPIAQTLDDTFLSAVEGQHAIDSTGFMGRDTSAERAAALTRVGEELSANVADKLQSIGRSRSLWPLKLLATLIILPLAALFAWNAYIDYRIAEVRSTALSVIAGEPEMSGYPLDLSVTDRGTRLVIHGLAPSDRARSRLIEDLKRRLPGVALNDRLNLVAGGDITVPDVTPELTQMRDKLHGAIASVTQSARERSTDRAETRIAQAITDLERAQPAISNANAKDSVKRIAANIAEVQASLRPLVVATLSTTGDNGNSSHTTEFQKLTRRLEALSGDLLAVVGVPATDTLKLDRAEGGNDIDTAIDQFATASERLAVLASTVATVKSLQPPPPKVVAAKATPRDALRTWTRDHAVFFADNLDYRDITIVERDLAELAAMMKSRPGTLRIVGYTDDSGNPDANKRLAQSRAEKVRDDLLALGVESAALIALGRADNLELSDTRGAGSPNRRVQFELTFEGEVAP